MTTQEIEALHNKYAPSASAFNLVFTHCQIVWDIAQQLILTNKLDVDIELVKLGCLVHDIGLYKLMDSRDHINAQHIKHGVLGYDLLKAEKVPELICRFASHHTGVGLTKNDVLVQKLPIPIADYLADTKEELLVMYADKFHSKTQPPRFISYESYKKFVADFGSDKVSKFEHMASLFGEPNLIQLADKYGYRIE